jgi:hypothetical protein
MRFPLLLAVAAALFLHLGCGYHVAGHVDLLPAKVKTIAIPAFRNATSRYRLTERIPNALTREFMSRTRYAIVSDPSKADAILQGSVLGYNSWPTVYDPVTGRAAGVQISVFMKVTLTERTTRKVLFNRPNMEFKERYEISTDQRAYFEESDVAIDRLSREVARTLVSAILENF